MSSAPTSHVRDLEWLSFYKAPPTTNITAKPIRDGIEYLELIVGGGVMYDDGVEDRERKCGSIFWHIGGDQTICRNIAARPYECMVFVFSVDGPPRRQVPRLTFWSNPQAVRDFAWEAFRAFQSGVMDRRLMCTHFYSHLLWQAMAAQTAKAKDALPEVLPKLLEYIEGRLGEDLQVGDLMRVGGISAPYLHKLFRRHFQTTPYQYVLSRKLQHACQLLAGTSYQVKMICHECGIRNPETFCRAFRRAYGMSPQEFRQSQTHDAPAA